MEIRKKGLANQGGTVGRTVCGRGKRGSEAAGNPDEGPAGQVFGDLGPGEKRLYPRVPTPSEAARSVGPEEPYGKSGPALKVEEPVRYFLGCSKEEYDFFSSICIQGELSKEKYGDPKKGPQAIEAMTAVDPDFIYGIIVKYLLRIKNRGAERFSDEDLAKVGRYTLLLKNQLSKARELLARPAGR